MKKYVLSIVLCLFVLSLITFSQENNDHYYIKIPEFTSPPKIDGKLENPIWERGAVLDTFTQDEPQEGARPSERTLAYIGYDEKSIYIAVRCFDSNTKGIRACLTKRDSISGDDEITIYLDTFNDKKRAFVFQVNPCGIQADGIYTETRRRGRGRGFFGFDRSWDTFFLSNAQMDETGYTIELAYTRKIVDPQWGVKLTGKTGKTSIGFLSVYDHNPPEITLQSPSDEDEDEKDTKESTSTEILSGEILALSHFPGSAAMFLIHLATPYTTMKIPIWVIRPLSDSESH